MYFYSLLIFLLWCFLSISLTQKNDKSSSSDMKERIVSQAETTKEIVQPSDFLSMLLMSSVILPAEGDVISSADIETLQLAQVIFRHGARSPLTSYDKDPYNNTQFWPDGLGQLTAHGKLMEFELGKYLKWRYTGFVKTYSPPEVYAQSSDIDRTIMSADLVLAGLFPPTEESPNSMWNPEINWHPVPVRTIPVLEDNKISFNAKCARYDTIYKEYLDSPAMKLLNEENVEMYKYLSEKSGSNITNIQGISDLYDVLYVQELHKLTLPDWTSRYYPDKLREVSEYVWEAIVGTKEMKRLRMGPLLGDLVINMDKHANSKVEAPSPNAKLYLYSGHDSTVSGLLGALGVFDRQTPPYSAAVMVELHQENKLSPTPGRHLVKIFFRNDTAHHPYEMKIPNCEDPCTLDQFKQLLSDIIIPDRDTWNKECQKYSIFSLVRVQSFFQGVEFWASLTFVIMFLFGVIMTSVIFAIVILPWHRKKLFLLQSDENYNKNSPSTSETSSRNSISNNNYKV